MLNLLDISRKINITPYYYALPGIQHLEILLNFASVIKKNIKPLCMNYPEQRPVFIEVMTDRKMQILQSFK